MTSPKATPSIEDQLDEIIEELFEDGILTGLGKNPLSAQEAKLAAKDAIKQLLNQFCHEVIGTKVKIGVSEFHPTKDEVKQIINKVRAAQYAYLTQASGLNGGEN